VVFIKMEQSRRSLRAWAIEVVATEPRWLMPLLCLTGLMACLWSDATLAQVNAVASGDSVWSAVRGFFYGKWALVIGCLVLVGCVFAFFSKGAMFASIGVAAVVVIYLLPAITQGLQSLAQGLVGN
jgi:hypothetical protein